MPRFLEEALRRSAAKQGMTGQQADRYTFGAMNNMGAMRGSKTTAKGLAMERKHEARESKAVERRETAREDHPHPHRNLGQYLHPKKGE
jgi:hypothetical protein